MSNGLSISLLSLAFCLLPLLRSQTDPYSNDETFIIYDYNPFPYGSAVVKMAYPEGCIKTSFNLDNYRKVECIYGGSGPQGIYITLCGADCSACPSTPDETWGVDGSTGYTTGLTLPDIGFCSLGKKKQRLDYIQTKIFRSESLADTSGCLASNAYTNNTLTFLTGICFQSEISGIYRMTECTPDTNSAATYTYTNSDCTAGRTLDFYSFTDNALDKNGSYEASYETSCEYLYQPAVGYNEWIYQRLDVCYANGSLLTFSPSAVPTTVPTSVPSMEPTLNPSTEPPTTEPTTIVPTYDPTYAPVPTTAIPTTSFPTGEPSLIPTYNPTKLPTAEPTFHPSQLPTVFRGVSVGSISFSQMTAIYIVFGVVVVFYIFICLYIWCNERRKRRTLINNYRRGKDKAERQKWLRQKSQQQQRVQMEQKFEQRNHERFAGNDFNVQMMNEGGR